MSVRINSGSAREQRKHSSPAATPIPNSSRNDRLR